MEQGVIEKNQLGIDQSKIKEKKRSKKFLKTVLFLLLGFLFITVSIGGYGFYQGTKVKNYALASEKMMTEPASWPAIFETDKADKVKSELEDVEKYCDDQLTLLSTPAPKKAKKLQENLIEYFKDSKEMSTSILEVVDWTIEIEKVTKDLANSDNFDVTTPEGMLKSLEDNKKQIDSTIIKMDGMEVPNSLKKDHDQIKVMLKKVSVAYDSLIIGIKNNDLGVIASSGQELAGAMEGFDPESYSNNLEKAFEEKTVKSEKLEQEIKAQILDLKEIVFSF